MENSHEIQLALRANVLKEPIKFYNGKKDRKEPNLVKPKKLPLELRRSEGYSKKLKGMA